MGTFTLVGWRDVTDAYVNVFSKATKAGALLTDFARVCHQGQKASRQRVRCTGRDMACLHTWVPNVLLWVTFLWMCCEVWLLSGCRRKLISQGSVWLSLLYQVIKDKGFVRTFSCPFLLLIECFSLPFCHKSMSLVWAAVSSGEPNVQRFLFHVGLCLFSVKHRGKHCKKVQGFGEVFSCLLKSHRRL